MRYAAIFIGVREGRGMRPEHWLYTIPLRLRSLFRWAQADQEVDDELRDHLERKTEEYVAQGMTQEEAHRRARLDLGGVEQTKEKCRDARRVNWIQDFIQDLRFGLRMLRKSPGSFVVAFVILALAIGANTAIFSLLDGVVLRDLPVPHPDQLVRFGAHRPGDDYAALSLPMFQELSRGQRVFSGTFAWWGDGVFNAEMDGRLAQADVWCADNNFYPELGAVPEIGRLFNADEENLSAAIIPLEFEVVGAARRGLTLLLAAVGVVMLIAC